MALSTQWHWTKLICFFEGEAYYFFRAEAIPLERDNRHLLLGNLFPTVDPFVAWFLDAFIIIRLTVSVKLPKVQILFPKPQIINSVITVEYEALKSAAPITRRFFWLNWSLFFHLRDRLWLFSFLRRWTIFFSFPISIEFSAFLSKRWCHYLLCQLSQMSY